MANLVLRPYYVPSELNIIVDDLSHQIEIADWTLWPRNFYELYKAWGPFSIDKFVSYFNAQLVGERLS